MNEKKKNMESRFLTLLFIALTSLSSKGQIENLKLPNKINFTLSTKAIIASILKDETLQLIRIDTSTEVFPSIVYRTSSTDSISLVFHRANFSIMRIYFNDPCYFSYLKIFCLENIKPSKESKKAKKQLFFGKDYTVRLYETWSIKQQAIIIESKKHPIHI